MNKKIKATAYLLFATLIWGSAFTAQSIGMDYIGPFTFQTARCVLASLFLFPVSWLFEADKKSFFLNWANPRLWKAGMLCGTALFLAAGLQQMGLVHTSAGKAGFITTLYIVMVPMIGTILGKRAPITAWIGVALALAGLSLLSGVSLGGVSRGDWMLMGCAFWFAVQIVLVDKFISQVDGVKLSCVQSLVCAVLSGLVMGFTEEVSAENLVNCAGPLLFAGIASMGIAYTLQILGQRDLPPTPAALIMSLESVFALLTGWLILKERMKPLELAGCALVFCAVILSQIPVSGKNKE